MASTAGLAHKSLYLVVDKILMKLAVTAVAAAAVAEVAEMSAYSNPSQYVEAKEVEVVENMLRNYMVIHPLIHQTVHIDSLVELRIEMVALAEVVAQMKLDSGLPGIQVAHLLIVQVAYSSFVVA